jgi:hypothetical protein
VTTGVRNHKQERKREGLIIDTPDLYSAFERRAMCGLGILIDSDVCDKDGVEICRPAESGIRPMAKAARPGNGVVCLALDAQRSGLARLMTPLAVDLTARPRAATLPIEPTEPPLIARIIERFGDSAAAPL